MSLLNTKKIFALCAMVIMGQMGGVVKWGDIANALNNPSLRQGEKKIEAIPAGKKTAYINLLIQAEFHDFRDHADGSLQFYTAWTSYPAIEKGAGLEIDFKGKKIQLEEQDIIQLVSLLSYSDLFGKIETKTDVPPLVKKVADTTYIIDVASYFDGFGSKRFYFVLNGFENHDLDQGIAQKLTALVTERDIDIFLKSMQFKSGDKNLHLAGAIALDDENDKTVCSVNYDELYQLIKDYRKDAPKPKTCVYSRTKDIDSDNLLQGLKLDETFKTGDQYNTNIDKYFKDYTYSERYVIYFDGQKFNVAKTSVAEDPITRADIQERAIQAKNRSNTST